MLVAALASLMLQTKDECLVFVSRNLAKGDANWYTYFTISEKPVKIKAGDKLVYDIFLDPHNPVAKGSVDLDVDTGDNLRDGGGVDSEGIRSHGDAILDKASGHWLHREIGLDMFKGKTTTQWNLNF